MMSGTGINFPVICQVMFGFVSSSRTSEFQLSTKLSFFKAQYHEELLTDSMTMHFRIYCVIYQIQVKLFLLDSF